MRPLRALVRLATLLCVAPMAAAQDAAPASAAADLDSVSRGASAEDALKERLQRSVRRIPGTDIEYLVGGYVQLDAMATRHRQDGDEQATFLVSSTPFGTAPQAYGASVRQSTLEWVSRMPTSAGQLWTRLQANLFPLDGTTRPTLNQLFVKLDPWITVGKTYTTFMDDGILPTTLDYNGPSGVTFVRQWLARGTLPIGERWRLEGSVEEAQADDSGAAGTLTVSTRATRPDLAARLRFEADAGHLQFAALSRRIQVETAAAGTGGAAPAWPASSQRVAGTGYSLSGSLAVGAAGTLTGQFATGTGVGRYFNDVLSDTGVALAADRRLELLRLSGATLYYQQRWAPDWMTVAGASTLWADAGDGVRAPTALRRATYASANLLHRIAPQLIVGAEVLWGAATRVDGQTADNLRLQLSARYLIF